jgi:hypothetical protein
MSFLLRLATAPDPGRGVSPDIARIVKADRNQVALKEPAQVIASAVEPELNATPVDCGLHLGWAAEGQADVSAAGSFFGHFAL